ncbi:Retinol dehydrogenase 14 [Coemansia erecta]|uniref:Retinol dehydrogenase 14 n=1 Tax=Coemansia asiatica TaxID=1052880 RepID=A0A9W8CK28_9FUNG|nr:Retinol dehydrogenase 14 [Coemansia asiatica]KAJ2854792.1 Retinol dehydrogenase 14 [Coemansia erecta]KAJ2859156.1 Retinol dehydrogenase 14 [Coemansia asiatica]
MSLASGANTVQSLIAKQATSQNKAVQLLSGTGILSSEILYAVASKFDPSVPRATSRIDRIIMDSCHQSLKNKQPNEQKIAIVTGANSGIGFETAKAIGRAGFHTILACRNMQLGEEAVEKLTRQTGLENRFELMHLDLASLESVYGFIEKFKQKWQHLDILVCNAGVMACPLMKTKDGIEMQFGINHVGHFALSTGLLDRLEKPEDGSRIVVLTSMGAFMTPDINFERIEKDSMYDRSLNYAISKLANMTFGASLARKLEGTKVTVNIAHPGSIATNLFQHVGGSYRLIRGISGLFLLDQVAGALTTIYLALDPQVEGISGVFFNRCLQMNMHPVALDIAEQDKLWAFTEKLIADKYKK